MAYKGKSKSLDDSYKLFCITHPDIAKKYTLQQYRNICGFANVTISNVVLEGGAYKFYNSLSSIFIMKVERTAQKLAVDFGETLKLRRAGNEGAIAYHTDKWYTRWFWDIRRAKCTNHYYYKFTPTRQNKRRLAYIMKNDPYIIYRKPNRKANDL